MVPPARSLVLHNAPDAVSTSQNEPRFAQTGVSPLLWLSCASRTEHISLWEVLSIMEKEDTFATNFYSLHANCESA